MATNSRGTPLSRRPTYERIRDLIVAGELEPGGLLSEPDLAEQLGVSRTPVREALAALTIEGLAVRLSSNRIMVAPVSASEIGYIYDIRSRLEGLIARDVSEGAATHDLGSLERHLVLMERMNDDYEEVVRLGASFHHELQRMSGNTLAVTMLQTIRSHVDRYRPLTTRSPGRAGDAVAEHRAVFEAIVSGDPDHAESVMRHHIDQARTVAIRLQPQH